MVEVIKVADRETVNIGDRITYTLTLKNNEGVDCENLLLKDTLSQALEYIDDSLYVDGRLIQGANLLDGIYLGKLLVGTMMLVVYKARVLQTTQLQLVNKAVLKYTLTTQQGTIENKEVFAQAIVRVNLKAFKQISLNTRIYVPVKETLIQEPKEVIAYVKVAHTKAIETEVGISNEGQVLSGHKLIIQGYLEVGVQYVPVGKCEKRELLCQAKPFTAFLVLPSGLLEKSISVVAEIKAISVNEWSEEYMDIGAIVLLTAQIGE
ncbi:MAG: DUF11 domain-containing protein [Cellulosilyticaceae bacterium]